MSVILKKVVGSLPLLFIILLAACLLLFPEITAAGAQKGLQICARSIIPALFPFFVVTNLWCSLGYAEKLGAFTAPVMRKLFHLPGNAASALTLGLIGGYPVGAQAVLRQYEKGELRKKEAEHLLLFCNNAGPAFIFGIAGAKIFQSTLIGLVLYLIHACSAVLLGIIFRGRRTDFRLRSKEDISKPSIAAAITEAIRQAGHTAIQVCIFVVFFAVLSSYLTFFLPGKWTNSVPIRFLLGTLELAGGAVLFSEFQNKTISFCLVSFMLGWGGLCVFFQTMSLLDESDLSKKHYVFSKLLHGLLSFLLAVIVSPFIPLPGAIISADRDFYDINILYPLLLISALIAFVCFLKKTSGKAVRNQV